MNYKGFLDASKWFDKQAEEVMVHARKIASHILSMNGKVKLAPKTEVKQEWGSLKEIFEDTLMHENRSVDILIIFMNRQFH